MLKLTLDFVKEEFHFEGEQNIGIVEFVVPELANVFSALAKLKRILTERLTEKVIVIVNGGNVEIQREGAEIKLPATKLVKMLDLVRREVSAAQVKKS